VLTNLEPGSHSVLRCFTSGRGDLGSRLGVDVKNRIVIEAEEREFFQKSIIFRAIASIVDLFQPHREDVTQTRD